MRKRWATGIRAFDTAPHYGDGLSERRIGEFLARPRSQFTVSTKVGRRLVPAAALQFTLHHPAVTAAVVGARSRRRSQQTSPTSPPPSPTPSGLNWEHSPMIAKALLHKVLNPS